MTAQSVPDAVCRVIDRWREAGSPDQAPTPWPRLRWLARFPQHNQFLNRLPDAMNRAAVRSVCADADASPDDAEAAFLAVMAWGYGTSVGYGPFRVARILALNEGVGMRLQRVAATLRNDGAAAAYGRLADPKDCRLKYLGPAFGTKFLAFCSIDQVSPALILDRFMAIWLNENTSLRLNATPWDPETYKDYLVHMHLWAKALQVPPDDLECSLFTAQAKTLSRNQWAPPA